jgi:hypothetical protein
MAEVQVEKASFSFKSSSRQLTSECKKIIKSLNKRFPLQSFIVYPVDGATKTHVGKGLVMRAIPTVYQYIQFL